MDDSEIMDDLDIQLVAAQSDDDMVQCCFDCGPPRPSCTMHNVGKVGKPRWMCPGCNGARKALEWACKGNPALRESLKTLKTTDFELYKAKVRAARIRQPGEPSTMPGVLDLPARKMAIQQVATTVIQLSQAATVQSATLVKPMTKKQYIAFLRYKEGEDIRTPEDEERWWSAAWNNPDISKNKEEGTILVNKGQP